MDQLPDQFTVCSWNILTTHANNAQRTVAQEKRIPHIVSDITAVSPDIGGFYEVRNQVVEQLPGLIGHSQHVITPYSQAEYGMSLALTSYASQHDSEIIEYPMDSRKAVAATIDGIQVVATHLSFAITRFDWRVKQVSQILETLDDNRPAIIMADFNCMPWQKPRKMIERAGFTSAAKLMKPSNPTTFPTPDYVPRLPRMQRLVSRRGLSIDDIYVRGLTILETGIIEGDSDHYGLWVRLSR